jgi:hypothetical protein
VEGIGHVWLNLFCDPQHLTNINFNRIKLHLKPLAISVNVTQQSNTHCDQVLVLLGQLWCVYVDMVRKDRSPPGAEDKDADHPCTTILKSIEKRWSKVDQDLFIACVFLNPSLKTSLFNPQKMTVAVLIGILRCLYMRVFRAQQCPDGFIQEIMHYVENTGIYSRDMWCVDELKDHLKDAVRFDFIVSSLH